MPLSFLFDLILEARAEILGFLEEVLTPKGHFEINSPLDKSILFFLIYLCIYFHLIKLVSKYQT